ncbi:ATP-dependent DNA helicase [Plasmodiophora brassicae]
MDGGDDHDPAVAALQRYFGFSTFREGQKEVIEACIAGRDCFVLMATGKGKSLCYQLPSLLTNRPTVVISPLIALMKDQSMALDQRGISSCFLNSTQRDQRVWEAARRGEYQIIFLSPEKVVQWLDSLAFIEEQLKITCFAIDESHCISTWGPQFRPAYRDLAVLRQRFPRVPIMALTATATPSVQDDIIASLLLRNPFILKTSFDRPNLFYSVSMKTSLAFDIPRALLQHGSSIIYCLRQQDTVDMCTHVQSLGLTAGAYHAGMTPSKRDEVHRAFANDEIKVVCATIAFGMGIDRADIRTVVSYGMPKSIEEMYQQAGRAGRDGLPAHCLLFYSKQDFGFQQFHMRSYTGDGVQDQALEAMRLMKEYATSNRCRRALILEHFGDRWTKVPCGQCDNCCQGVDSSSVKRNFTKQARWAALALRETRERFGLGVPAMILKGSNRKEVQSKASMFAMPVAQMQSFGTMREHSESWIKEFLVMCATHKVIEPYKRQTFTLYRLGPLGLKLLSNPSFQLDDWTVSGSLQAEERVSMPALRTVANRNLIRSRSKSMSLPSSIRRAPKPVQPPTAVVPRQQAGADAAPEQEPVPNGWTRKVLDCMSQYEAFDDDLEEAVYKGLLQLRKDYADRTGLYAYQICNEVTLRKIAKFRPSTMDSLRKIPGLPAKVIDQMGPSMLALIQSKVDLVEGGEQAASRPQHQGGLGFLERQFSTSVEAASLIAKGVAKHAVTATWQARQSAKPVESPPTTADVPSTSPIISGSSPILGDDFDDDQLVLTPPIPVPDEHPDPGVGVLLSQATVDDEENLQTGASQMPTNSPSSLKPAPAPAIVASAPVDQQQGQSVRRQHPTGNEFEAKRRRTKKHALPTLTPYHKGIYNEVSAGQTVQAVCRSRGIRRDRVIEALKFALINGLPLSLDQVGIGITADLEQDALDAMAAAGIDKYADTDAVQAAFRASPNIGEPLPNDMSDLLISKFLAGKT